MRNRFTNIGWLVTTIVAITPVLLWLLTQPTQWQTNKLVIENLGKLAGLAGLSLFAWNVILSSRLKIFDKLFMGLDNMYRAHHLIGSTAFIFLLIHPILLTTRYLLTSPISAYEFLKPSIAAPFKILGTLTLGTMMILIIITLYINVKHEWFVMTQRLLGAILFLGGIHAIFVGGSDIRDLVWLQIYIIGLLALAAVVYVYRSLFHGNFSKYFDYAVDSMVQKNEVLEVYLKPKTTAPKFLPGQFAFVKIESNGVLGQSHPFTISSSPKQGYLRFSIKCLGDYTAEIVNVKKGQTVKIDAPYGSFSNKVVLNNRQVWVAGGIGVTPFLAMSADLDGNQRVDMYYSVKDSKEAVYANELQKIANTNKNFRLNIVYTSKDGFLTADGIFEHSDALDVAAFLVCGPPSMMKSLRTQLRLKGVANKNIHTEEFSLL